MPVSNPLEIHTAAHSVTGRRNANQDAVMVRDLGDRRTLLALADGMGGHAAGEVASRLSLETIVDCLLSGSDLRDAFEAADTAVRTEAEKPGQEGMGTTLVAAIVGPDGYEVANVGDSRAYWVDAEGARQLTLDHSFVAERVRDGLLSPEQAERSPVRNLLTRAVGGGEPLEVDTFGPFRPTAPGMLLLSSDGLHGAIDGEAIAEVLREHAEAESAAHALVESAHGAGSSDNISVVLAELGQFLEGGSG